MATKIPQNIDKEDRLVGPLTLKQFLYVLGGLALAFVVYQYYVMGYLYFTEFVLIASLPVIAALLLAFGQVNGRPFITFLTNLLTYINTPKLRYWSKQNTINERNVKVGKSSGAPIPTVEVKNISHGRLEQLAHILDTGGKMESADFADTHEIKNLSPSATPKSLDENDLGVEDILADTEK
jgi:hypothetical protein